MSDPLGQFVRACQAVNSAAAIAGYPPFAAAFRSETPLNSAPYIFTLSDFGRAFGSNARRRAILAEAAAALDALGQDGIVWQLLLIGGSFIRTGDLPSDLDGLVVYALVPAAAAAVDQRIRRIGDIMPRYPRVDFKFCPVDTDPIVLVKRLLFFSNVFGYDKHSHTLSRGSVMVVPDATGATLLDGSEPDDR